MPSGLRAGSDSPTLLCFVVEARDVYAYINDREEKEVLLFPQRHLEVTRVWPTKGDNVGEVLREIRERRNQRERLRLHAAIDKHNPKVVSQRC